MAEDIPEASGLICRDYLRNVCQRGDNCKFMHKKEEVPERPQFCKYFLSNGCFRTSCKFLHCSEKDFYANRIPTCKDYYRGKCFRENCKFLHKDDPTEPAGRLEDLPPAQFDNSMEPFPGSYQPSPAPLSDQPPYDSQLHIEIQRLKFQNDFLIKENDELRKKNAELKKDYEYIEKKYEELRKNEEQRTLRAYSFCNNYSSHIAPELVNNSASRTDTSPLPNKYPLVSYPLKSISGRDSGSPYHRPN